MMTRHTFPVGVYAVNCSILSEGKFAWIVDPGSDSGKITAHLAKRELQPQGILLTHAHFDHICGIPELQCAYPDLPVYVHPNDAAIITHPMNQLPPDYPPISQPKNVRAPENLPMAVIETPGHTPGGVCYYLEEEKLLIAGDTLFAGSIGRTDLPGGDMATLMASLEKLKTLPADTKVIPGHGMFTTIADELAGNPFMQ